MNLFDIDNPVLVFLGRVVDLMLLNLLTLVFCIPIVTAGASFTAMHYVALKIYRDEYSGVSRIFMKSFKLNLRQGIIMGLFFLVPGAVVSLSLYMVMQGGDLFPAFLRIALVLALLLLVMVGTTAFTLLSRFENTVPGTLINGIILTFSLLPRSLMILVLHLLPLFIMYFMPPATPLAVLFFFSVPAIGTAWLLDPMLRKLEAEQRKKSGDDQENSEAIFKDMG